MNNAKHVRCAVSKKTSKDAAETIELKYALAD